MSDKGYLSNKIENALAKLMDDTIDFKEKHILFGLVGLEKNDRKLFKTVISLIDDKVIGNNPNSEIKAEIDQIIVFIWDNNVQGFIDHVADLLTDKININLGSAKKKIYLGLLQFASGIIESTFNEIKTFTDSANAES